MSKLLMPEVVKEIGRQLTAEAEANNREPSTAKGLVTMLLPQITEARRKLVPWPKIAEIFASHLNVSPFTLEKYYQAAKRSAPDASTTEASPRCQRASQPAVVPAPAAAEPQAPRSLPAAPVMPKAPAASPIAAVISEDV
jgi:hypothetical protein